MKDIVSIGEILVDCVPYQLPELARPLYQMNPGGAPANVACVAAKLGDSSGFIGRVGDDVFGRDCTTALAECGVDTSLILVAKDEPTTLAFVCLDGGGNRSFSFYRTHTADVGLSREQLEEIDFPEARIFHFGAVSLTTQPARAATLYAVERAKKAGSIISYDPNLRLSLWADPKEAHREILSAIPLADIIKLSEEEGEFLFGETDPVKICARVEAEFSPSMVVVTQAEKGCTCSIKGEIRHSRAYAVKTLDTTGAGDCSFGGLLHCLLKSGKRPEQLTGDEVTYMLDFSNAAGSLATAKKGAIPSIPTIAEIEGCIAGVGRI